MLSSSQESLTSSEPVTSDTLDLLVIAQVLARRWRQLVLIPLTAGAIAVGFSFLIPPQFTARTTLIPPQSGGSSIGAALSALGPLASLAGGVGAPKGSGEMYVSILQSETIADRLISRFSLKQLYEAKYQSETREILKNRSRIAFGKRDGLITIEVDDTDPARASKLANQYVDELRRVTAGMTLTEAQRRRVFFEEQLRQTRIRLVDAQNALQSSGFNQGAIKAEPKAAAEEYGRMKAELTTAEVRLKTMKSRLTDTTPEVTQLTTMVAALRAQLQSLEQKSSNANGQDYVSDYREFKYQESLFEQLSKQFEAARLEESREDASIQVVDRAQVPERKSKPKRASIGIASALACGILMCLFVIGRHLWGSRSSHRTRAA